MSPVKNCIPDFTAFEGAFLYLLFENCINASDRVKILTIFPNSITLAQKINILPAIIYHKQTEAFHMISTHCPIFLKFSVKTVLSNFTVYKRNYDRKIQLLDFLAADNLISSLNLLGTAKIFFKAVPISLLNTTERQCLIIKYFFNNVDKSQG